VNPRVVGLLCAGFLTTFAAFGIRYSYGILLPEMLPALGISKTEAGIIFSSYFLFATFCSPVLGLLVDRWNARFLLTIFIAILGMGAYLMSFSTTVVQASFFFALAGIGHSACWAPFVTVLMRWVSDKRRGIALSIIDLGSTAGIAFWSIMIPFIIGPYSWRTVWVWLGVSAFVAAAMNFLFVKSRPSTETEPQVSVGASEERIPIKTAYKAIFRDKKFYLIGLSYLLISFSILIPFTFLTTYAAQELKIPYQTAAGLVALIGIVGAIGKLPLGHLSDMVGRVKIMMLCGVLTGIGGLGMAYSQGIGFLFVFTVVFGVGYGTIWPVYAASSRDLFSPDYSGSVVGLWTLYHGLGSVLAPVFAGWTIDATGSYVWAFIMAVISSALSLLVLLPLVNAGKQ
jgi:MFS family permease